MTRFNDLLNLPPGSLSPHEKVAILLPELRALTDYHAEHCSEYSRILNASGWRRSEGHTLDALPFLPVGLFKRVRLSSTERATGSLLSSGTTGQQPSIIVIDAETADRQSQALVSTFRPVLGEQRLPLLLIDNRQILANPATLSARGAGVLGMMKLGSRATFALDTNLQAIREVIVEFVRRQDRPFVIFGFTFLVWSQLYEAFADGELDLSNATLIHSGGWKTLEARKVSNDTFRSRLASRFGMTRIVNFYGFVEQIGSMFLEAAPGLLRAPIFTDVIIRDPTTWEPLPDGETGIIQTVSLLPRSYPGHNVLTEDLGAIETVPDPETGIAQRLLRVFGRIPKAELRGCSDVIGASGL